ncbi:hypothetical protein [Priestia aryabhattai]|uniref:hypothetical protein n=1 Tax=Priestia aryabhattai TaxID=412384 RepID=UPI001CCE68B9|nr:hypothetical protein [Priestia aryabhattai]MBZ6489050.1 hypothetical protein [Priestia aryabhattai]
MGTKDDCKDAYEKQADSDKIESFTSMEELQQEMKKIKIQFEQYVDSIQSIIDSNNEYILKGDKIDPSGLSDSHAAIQNFFDNVAQNGGGVIKVPKGTYRYDFPLNYYPDKISLIAYGNVTFRSTQSLGHSIHIKAFEKLNVKEYLEQAHLHKIYGIRFSADNKNSFIFLSKGDNKGKYASAWTIERCSIVGSNCIEINNDTWLANIEKCYINPKGGYGIYMPKGGINYGEKIGILNCTFDESGIAIYNNNGEGDIKVINTSIDYGAKAVIVNGGEVTLDNVFVESNKNEHWFEIEGYGAQLNISAIQIVDKYDKGRTEELFRVHDSSDNLMGAGLTAESIRLMTTSTPSTFLVKGKGRTIINRIDTFKDANKPIVSRYLNKLAFGDCNSINSIHEWENHKISSIKPVLDFSEKYEGIASIRFSVINNDLSTGQRIQFLCKPGEMVRLKYHVKTKNLQYTQKNFNIERRFLNNKGYEISRGIIKNINTDILTWTEQLIVPSIEAPPGTHFVEINCFGENWTTETSVWLDDIVINII